MKIKDKLEYAPGQIANKVIARNASGMVVMMAFDKDAALATHTAPAVAVVSDSGGSMCFHH